MATTLNSSFSINWHTRGESPDVYVNGNEGGSIWVVIKYGEQELTIFMPDEWHAVSLADHILHAANEHQEKRTSTEEIAW